MRRSATRKIPSPYSPGGKTRIAPAGEPVSVEPAPTDACCVSVRTDDSSQRTRVSTIESVAAVAEAPPAAEEETASVQEVAPASGDGEYESVPAPSSPPPASGQNEAQVKTQVLLLLSQSTFVGQAGEVLANRVRAAMEANMSFIMIHQTDVSNDGCEFERFFSVTPPDLIKNGLYRQLAVPWYPAPHLRVSCVVAAQALGAVQQKNSSRRSNMTRVRNLDPQVAVAVHEIRTGKKQAALSEDGEAVLGADDGAEHMAA